MTVSFVGGFQRRIDEDASVRRFLALRAIVKFDERTGAL
jgi:hypothetical protein